MTKNAVQAAIENTLLVNVFEHVAERNAQGWSVLIVDAVTTQFLSAHVRLSDVLARKISKIEQLELARCAYPELSAIYILSDSHDSTRRLRQDFDGLSPMYGRVHVYTISAMSQDFLTSIQQSPVLMKRLMTLQELHLDFYPMDAHAFRLHEPGRAKTELRRLSGASRQKTLKQVAKQLMSVCHTLQALPTDIRFDAGHNPSTDDPTPSQELAQELVQRIVEWQNTGSNDGGPSTTTTTTLLILDRTSDLLSPLLHDCSYEAMLYDLMNQTHESLSSRPILIHNAIVEYPVETQGQGVMVKRSILSQSPLWQEIQGQHIAQVSEALTSQMSALRSSHVDATLGERIQNLSNYQATLDELTLHLFLVSTIMNRFTNQGLLSIVELEHTLATGVDPEGKAMQWKDWIRNVHILCQGLSEKTTDVESHTDETLLRIVMMILILQKGWTDKERKDWLKYFREPHLVQRWILNLHQLGQRINAPVSSTGTHALRHFQMQKIHGPSKVKLAQAKRDKQSNAYFSTTRYRPPLDEIVQALVTTQDLSQVQYPYFTSSDCKTDHRSTTTTTTTSQKKSIPGSRRRDKSNKSKTSQALGKHKYIVFVLGGATYSEHKIMSERMNIEKEVDIYFGASEFLTAKEFFTQVQTLNDDPIIVSKPESEEDIRIEIASGDDRGMSVVVDPPEKRPTSLSRFTSWLFN